MKKSLYILLIIAISTTTAMAGGILKGKVFDSDSGEELIGSTVQIIGTKKGARTDINGQYQISNIDPGSYSIVVKYISYADKTIEGVKITEGKVTTINVGMSVDGQMTEEIVVRADRINNNEAALLSLQKNSINVQDGISTEQISNLGASNSADAMKQVTGASIEGGKYVVMRGLGDRYSISQLNGTTLPSTDPYRNSSSMDLISSDMIENIVTKKTFTPDQPGNFTGGNVDITTKSLPDRFYMNAGLSVGYNTISSLNDEFLTDPIDGGTDFLGIDDGSRELPSFYSNPENRENFSETFYIEARNKNNTEANQLFDQISRDFNTPFVPERQTSGMNFGASLGFGDRFDFEDDRAIGYNFSFNFSNGYSLKENWQLTINEYLESGDGALRNFLTTNGNQGTRNVNWGGILSTAFKINEYNEISLEGIFNHDGEEQAGALQGSWPGAISIAHTYFANNIAFIERDLVSGQLKGKHVFGDDNNIKVNWLGGVTGSSQYEPDMRAFSYYTRTIGDETAYIVNDNELQLPFHFYRDLQDVQYTGKADIEIPFGERSSSNSMKFGTMTTFKDRNFGELRFQLWRPSRDYEQYIDFSEADGDFDRFFDPSNFGIIGDDESNPNRWALGNSFVNQTQASNRYTGTELISAVYGMVTYDITEDLKTVAGLRVEYTNMQVEAGNGVTGGIDVVDPLPSLNFIYSLTDDQNLRLSGSRTVARPNLRELAPFSSVDFIGGFFYKGNDTLQRTNILNLDARWEWFPNPGEVLAVSAFYKNFENPIIRQLNPQASGGQVVFVNVPTGQLYGLEFEYRQSLGIINETLEYFNFAFNTTLTASETELLESELETFRNINPNYPETRPFIAQSPFIVNLNLGYDNPDWGSNFSLSFNMWGERFTQAGFGGAPDLYEVRGRVDGNDVTIIPDINFNYNQQLTDNWKINFKVNNILNAPFLTYQTLGDEVYVVESFEIGQTFGLGLKYSF
jgi:outer membrane receptor protein involved in Fe transport